MDESPPAPERDRTPPVRNELVRPGYENLPAGLGAAWVVAAGMGKFPARPFHLENPRAGRACQLPPAS